MAVTVEGDDPADYLMSGNDGITRGDNASLDDVEVCSADAAHRHADQNLTGRWLGYGDVGRLEHERPGVRGRRPPQQHGAHESQYTPWVMTRYEPGKKGSLAPLELILPEARGAMLLGQDYGHGRYRTRTSLKRVI